MPAKKPSIPRPPMPWAKRKKVPSPLNQPVVAKDSQKKEHPTPKKESKPISSLAQLEEVSFSDPFVETEIETVKVPLSSTVAKPSTTTTRKPLAVLGRRPDYKHHLVGLNVGDLIVFHKNPSIKATIEDTEWKVSINGVEYEGIIPAAEEAYKVSGLTPPKRITGLSEWRNPDGVRLRVLYEKLLPLTSTLPQPTSTQEASV